MFENVQAAPPDPILGLSEAFNKDERSHKINLSVGVYKDAAGATPILPTVHEAEKRLLETQKSKGYKPIEGDPAYGKLVRELLFGKGSDLVSGGLAATCHTPGGTGALRLAADFLSAGIAPWILRRASVARTQARVVKFAVGEVGPAVAQSAVGGADEEL